MKSINLCIAYPNKNIYSETFIRTQVEQLKPEFSIYGGWFPVYDKNDRTILKFPINSLILRGIIKNVFPRFFIKAYTNQLVDYLSKNKVDVLLAEYGPTGCSFIEVIKVKGIPLVVHFHGFDSAEKSTLKKYKSKYQELFKIASKIVVVSETMKNDLVSIGAPVEKIINNPYGVDLNLYNGTNPSSNPPVFVAVGRFAEKKAPHLTIKSFSIAKKICTDSKLIMIGNGPLLDKCRNLAKELGIIDSVKFKGVLEPLQVRNELAAARAFVQHSVKVENGDTEGTPNSILEASAMGLPVISTFHAGIKEAVIHGNTGFLVNEGDIDKMAEYMIKLASDAALASQLGKNARTHMEKNYSLEFRINKLKEILFSTVD